MSSNVPPPAPPGPGEPNPADQGATPPSPGETPAAPPVSDPYAAPAGDASSAPPPPPAPPTGGGYGDPGAYPAATEGYASAPPAASTPQAGPPVARPASMDNAVRLMQLGGVLSILGLLLALLDHSAFRDSIEKTSRNSTKPLTADQIDSAVAVSIGLAVVGGLIFTAIWFWMASANGKGRSWARIVATVLFGFSVIFFFLGFTQAAPILSRLISILSFLVGVGAIVLMYRRESSEYYRAMSAPPV